jgi:hypothetical protein
MVWVGRLNLATPWLLTSLVLYVRWSSWDCWDYTPTLRQQIRALESQGPDALDTRRWPGVASGWESSWPCWPWRLVPDGGQATLWA